MSTDTLVKNVGLTENRIKDTEYFIQKYRIQITLPMGHLMGLSSISSESKILGTGAIMERSRTNGSRVTGALAVALDDGGLADCFAISFVC